MRNFRKMAVVAVLAGLVAGGTSFADTTADSGKKFQPPAHIQDTQDGTIFVSPQGMTLYVTRGQCPDNDQLAPTPDSANIGIGPFPPMGTKYQKSCAQIWTPYLADASAVPDGDWTIVTRADGGRQWAYRGGALYFSIRDKRPGDRNGVFSIDGDGDGNGGGGGRGRGAVFSLAGPPLNFPVGLKLVRDANDLVLAGPNGVPLLTPKGRSVHATLISTDGSENGVVPEVLQAPLTANLSDFEPGFSIINKDTEPQFAFRGHPLYRMSPDMDRRDLMDLDDTGAWSRVVYRKGDGLPQQIKTHMSIVGEIYTDSNGKTLYRFLCPGQGCDTPGGPAAVWAAMCGLATECEKRWHPYLAAADARPVGDWSIVDLAVPLYTDPAGATYGAELPRVKVWAFRGRPVYSYFEDKVPGDVLGNSIRFINATPEFLAVLVPGHNLDSGGQF